MQASARRPEDSFSEGGGSYPSSAFRTPEGHRHSGHFRSHSEFESQGGESQLSRYEDHDDDLEHDGDDGRQKGGEPFAGEEV